MHPLTHAKVALDVIHPRQLTPFERNLLIVGSALPDISDFGISNEPQTHTKNEQFWRFLPKEYKYLGIGAILHGENPKGLDYYTHDGIYKPGGIYKKTAGNEGYLAGKWDIISNILNEYKKKIKVSNENNTIHLMIEFCFDHLVAQAQPELPGAVAYALKSIARNAAVVEFGKYFGIDKKNVRKVKRILRSGHVRKFFTNCSTIEGTAHNFQNFLFFQSIREKDEHARHHFIHKLARVAQSSLGFLQTKLHDRALVHMFEECITVIRPDYQEFLATTTEKLKVMVHPYTKI